MQIPDDYWEPKFIASLVSRAMAALANGIPLPRQKERRQNPGRPTKAIFRADLYGGDRRALCEDAVAEAIVLTYQRVGEMPDLEMKESEWEAFLLCRLYCYLLTVGQESRRHPEVTMARRAPESPEEWEDADFADMTVGSPEQQAIDNQFLQMLDAQVCGSREIMEVLVSHGIDASTSADPN